MNDRVENFLKELSELTNKYNIAIDGCRCCGSPYLYNLNDNDSEPFELGECLNYDKNTKEYEIDND